jgi:hypothetical protein
MALAITYQKLKSWPTGERFLDGMMPGHIRSITEAQEAQGRNISFPRMRRYPHVTYAKCAKVSFKLEISCRSLLISPFGLLCSPGEGMEFMCISSVLATVWMFYRRASPHHRDRDRDIVLDSRMRLSRGLATCPTRQRGLHQRSALAIQATARLQPSGR